MMTALLGQGWKEWNERERVTKGMMYTIDEAWLELGTCIDNIVLVAYFSAAPQ